MACRKDKIIEQAPKLQDDIITAMKMMESKKEELKSLVEEGKLDGENPKVINLQKSLQKNINFMGSFLGK